MTDNTDRLLGSLVAEMKNVKTELTGVRSDLKALVEKQNTLKSQVDTIQAEHNDRKGTLASCTINTGATTEVSPGQAIARVLLGQAGGGVVGAGLVLVIILVLKRYGLI